MNNFDDVEQYKRKKEKRERELKRELTGDEKTQLYDSVLDSIWKKNTIPKSEISDEEIAALKD